MSRLLDGLQALHRRALRAFPRGFRERYGDEMSVAFRAYCQGASSSLGMLRRGVHGVFETIVEGVQERTGGGSGVGGTAIELRAALRGLVRSPGFAAAVMVVLALGIGASAAVFGLAETLRRGAPFDAGASLVVVGETFQEPGGPLEERAASYPTFRDWSEQTTAFEALTAWNARQLPLLSEDGAAPSSIGAAFVSASLPGVLRIAVSGGRWFAESEDAAAARVAVVSDDLWRTRLGGGPFVSGRTLRLGDVVVDVVGVAPPGFRGTFGDLDIWLPIHTLTVFDAGRGNLLESRGTRGLFVLGRLRAGVTLADADRQLIRVTESLRESGALPETRGARIEAFADRYFGDARRNANLLLGAVALLLLIACANIANLMLTRQIGRRQELALRRALGARGIASARPLLLEGVLLALFGGGLGVLVAPWLMQAVSAATLAGLPDYVRPALRPTTVVFALLIAIATAVVSSVAPALMGERTANAALRGGRGTLGRGDRGRRLLVVAQIAVAVPLLIGAGLMLRSIAAQLAIDPGFRAEGVVTAEVSLPRTRYDGEAAAAFAGRLQDALSRVPGTQVAIAGDVPIASGYSATIATVEHAGVERDYRVYVHSVSADYFDVLGMRMVEGRAFDARDGASGTEVVILSETAARRFYPGESAVGRLIEGAQVVGVVADAAFRTLLPDPVGNPDDPDIFLSFPQRPAMSVNVLLRGDGNPTRLVEQVREEVRRIDPSLPVAASSTLAEIVDGQVSADRALARQLAVFAVFALLLAGTGLYGVMAYSVSSRAPEIGVRMALGAERHTVLRQIFVQGTRLVAIGLALGLLVALLATSILRSQLYGVTRSDPFTYLVVAGVLAVAGMGATAIPAWRAMRVEPARVLRG